MPEKKKGIRVTVHDLDTGEQITTHEIVGVLPTSCTCCCCSVHRPVEEARS
jgi:hypothetical protein